MSKVVQLPALVFQHPIFKRKRLVRIGMYSWLCANEPVYASVRDLAAEWVCDKSTVARTLDMFVGAGLIRRDALKITIVPWGEVTTAAPRHDRVSMDALRLRVFERDGYRCVYCGGNEKLQCDHVKPSSRGGLTVFTNLVTACEKCNYAKGRLTPREWLEDGQ